MPPLISCWEKLTQLIKKKKKILTLLQQKNTTSHINHKIT